MSTNQLMFILFSAMILVFSVLTVTSRKILRAAIYLLFVLIATAGIYFMLDFEFMAGVQLTLYAGGIVVLIIFSILLTHGINHKFEKAQIRKILPAAIVSVAGLAISLFTVLHYAFKASTNPAIKKIDMTVIGNQLMSIGENGYALPFEVISILLLAAMIAAIIIAKKGI